MQKKRKTLSSKFDFERNRRKFHLFFNRTKKGFFFCVELMLNNEKLLPCT